MADAVSISASVSMTNLPADVSPVAVYLARLAPGSRRTMAEALSTIAGLLTGTRADAASVDWSALRYQHAQAVRAALAGRYAPATANKMLSALRGVLQETWRLGLLSSDDYHRAADLQPVRGETLPAGRAVARTELEALFGSCADEGGATGARDAAILAVLYGAGIRRAEACSLDVADYRRADGTLRIRSGKGAKAREVYATNGGRSALEAWLQARGATPGALFLAVNRGGNVQPHGLTPGAVGQLLQRRAAKAGVAAFSPHDLRRTFISDLLDAGADITAVAHLAGHANVQTTARYDRRGERAKRRAAELLHVPFVAR